MDRSSSLFVGIVLFALLPAAAAVAAEKEEPGKFKYTPIPVEASCLDGYHPTVDPKWGNVFPCIKDAEIVAPPPKPVADKKAKVLNAP